MLEFAEVLNISRQLQETIVNKTVRKVYPPIKVNKFCWFNGDAADYDKKIKNSRIISVDGFGLYVELSFNNGQKLCINDGVNARILTSGKMPSNYQLAIEFDDGEFLIFTIAMYGGIVLHDGSYDNEYYLKSKAAKSPFDADFKDYYYRLLSESKPSLSAKAFLATEQRFVGIGNGTLQDILFAARINPKSKIKLLNESETERLFESVVVKLREITDKGGRDTEKDIFGNECGYRTLMSKKTCADGCPVCHGEITKEAFLGGSVYYCKKCQPLK